MVKLLGSLFVLCGGGMAWVFQRRERRRRRDTLFDLVTALRRMGEEIRMTRMPLPRLLGVLAADCGPDAAALLHTAAAAAARGEGLTEAWCAGIEALPLHLRDQAALRSLEFQGDEENFCKGISLATYRLAESVEAMERAWPEEEKRTAALCFSAAALLVILLV